MSWVGKKVGGRDNFRLGREFMSQGFPISDDNKLKGRGEGISQGEVYRGLVSCFSVFMLGCVLLCCFV